MKNASVLLATACALVIGVYIHLIQPGVAELRDPNAADAYYNLLVQGFQAGHLSLNKEVPPGLAHLANPYDPLANAAYQAPPYRMHDMSYYKSKLYLDWGVTPALILFWPFAAFTGEYLFHSQAVLIFCAIGFLASVGLLRALWHRYFAEVSVWVVAACAVALGLATGMPVLVSQADVYEVPISCAYMLTMLALGAIWCTLHKPERRCQWLAAASVAYGLAVGARPSLLFGAIILLVPVIQSWRAGRKFCAQLMAAIFPITLIGLGLMLYNARRFDNPFEFGLHYQLGGIRQDTGKFFSLSYLWYNFRVYFLDPAHWSARSPYVRDTAVSHAPTGYAFSEKSFGVLTNIPLAWLALLVALAWRSRSDQARSILRWFAMTVALSSGICALTLALYWSSAMRHEVDFLPALLLLAVVGILGLERVLVARPVWRRAARWGWSLLLGFSVAFNLLASVGYYAEARKNVGSELFEAGKLSEAIGPFEEALRIDPDYAEVHNKLAVVLYTGGNLPQATAHFEQAIRIKPDYADAYNNLGTALAQAGRLQEAIEKYKRALLINPDLTAVHYSLARVFELVGNTSEAIGEYDTLAAAHAAAGRFDDAIATAQKAIELARVANQPEVVKEITTRLELYRTGRPIQTSKSPP